MNATDQKRQKRQFCRKCLTSAAPAVTLTFDGGTRRLHWCADCAEDAERYRDSSDQPAVGHAPSDEPFTPGTRVEIEDPDRDPTRFAQATVVALECRNAGGVNWYEQPGYVVRYDNGCEEWIRVYRVRALAQST